jgi:hypothetical protein
MIVDEHEIIRAMKSTTPVDEPDDFQDRLMDRVQACRSTPWFRFREFMLRARELSFDPARTLREGTTREIAVLYFLIASFAHLVLAVVLATGLRGIPRRLPDITWPSLQPQLAFLLAFLLACCSLMIRRGTLGSLRAAKWAIFCYIEISVINAVIPVITYGNQLFMLPLALLTLGEVLVGWFLACTLRGQMESILWQEG